MVEAIGNCDTEKHLQPDCRFDTDCPGDLKCCDAACGRRVCNVSIKSKWKYSNRKKKIRLFNYVRDVNWIS